ncbi:hypothetical protein N0V93_001914 [Gnomoniopsis smithogilvyi]|uniref:Integral membrane protein n=1 Tax=Gnomoniopsis smithogilvyi TaxID=1191159 RepID=A0A9W8Z4G0_9PEZI|nr:hypothetical protein N0V93_001914 [Gnomoniopsis smithogilvyi]
MRRRLRISVMFILGIGALASIAVTVRCFYYKYYDVAKYPDNYLFHLGITVLLSMSECGLGIVAVSLPPLCRLFGRYFDQSSDQSSGEGSGFPSGKTSKFSDDTPKRGRSVPTWNRIDDEDDEIALQPMENTLGQNAAPEGDKALKHPYMSTWDGPKDDSREQTSEAM